MLNRTSTALVIIDIQVNLYKAMQEKESILVNALKLIKGANVFGIPIIVTEQIPEKLGATLPAVIEVLESSETISKDSFSCWGNNHFQERIKALGRHDIIILGIESHVCVYQTAIDLMGNGYKVHVAGDAVSSRTIENCAIGIEAMKNAGAHITSAEMLIFELLRSAGDAKFKDIYKIVK
jgi:nicotinamidase-related amidase